jgi:hypothetical protein
MCPQLEELEASILSSAMLIIAEASMRRTSNESVDSVGSVRSFADVADGGAEMGLLAGSMICKCARVSGSRQGSDLYCRKSEKY